MLRLRIISLVIALLASLTISCNSAPADISAPTQPSSQPQSATTSDEPMAVMASIQGEVEINNQGSTWTAASCGIELKADDSIRTGDNSSALITFFEGSSIELESNTKIKIAELAIDASTGTTTIKMGQSIGSTVSVLKNW
jgi:hypothetical protein